MARPLLIARRIPGVSDQVAAIAWGSFCQLLRAPEAKMMLLPPLMLLCIFGSSFYFMADSSFPRQASTVVMFSGIGATLLSITQFLCNSFGFDRQGFRAYLLMPVERRDLLLGKNLSLLPLVFALYGVVIVLTVLTLPVRPFQIPTALIQMLNAYLLMAPVANLVAIRFPVTVPIAGSLRPQQVQWAPLLMQFAMMLVISVALLPAALAWGGEFLAESLTDVTWVPWSLLVSLVETGLIGLIYFHALEEEGRYLQRRETLILEVVAAAHE
ncbi:MAG: hypothetical protein U0872_09470 [Planctomycetaceae bacterium]